MEAAAVRPGLGARGGRRVLAAVLLVVAMVAGVLVSTPVGAAPTADPSVPGDEATLDAAAADEVDAGLDYRAELRSLFGVSATDEELDRVLASTHGDVLRAAVQQARAGNAALQPLSVDAEVLGLLVQYLSTMGGAVPGVESLIDAVDALSAEGFVPWSTIGFRNLVLVNVAGRLDYAYGWIQDITGLFLDQIVHRYTRQALQLYVDLRLDQGLSVEAARSEMTNSFAIVVDLMAQPAMLSFEEALDRLESLYQMVRLTADPAANAEVHDVVVGLLALDTTTGPRGHRRDEGSSSSPTPTTASPS